MSELVFCQSDDREAVILQETEETISDSQSEVDDFIPSKTIIYSEIVHEIYRNSKLTIIRMHIIT